MKNFKLVIGIDISKNTLDLCIIKDPGNRQLEFLKVSNCKKGIESIFKALKKYEVPDSELLFCFENTGVYGIPLCYSLQNKEVTYSMVPAIEIKRAKGLTRGKSDKTDAKDIALYAITHLHKLAFTQLPESDLMRLKLSLTERDKLVKAITLFKATKESKGFLSKELSNEILKHNSKTISILKKQLLELENIIKSIIKQNEKINKQLNLIQSVPGVGPQTAIQLIVSTRCFTAFDNWRKLACYAGVAPFEYSSGTSIKGKSKVSHMADKKLKSLLNMAALAAKKHDKQFKDYYERKTKEGKNGMLVMNALRCKILSRVFATIKRETPYVDFLKFAA
jgi:transposase